MFLTQIGEISEFCLLQRLGFNSGQLIRSCDDFIRILLMNLTIFFEKTDLACFYMMVTPFYNKPYKKNMKNLQTKIYLALFLDLEYFAPSQSYKILIRVSSEKTYCNKIGDQRSL